MQSQELNILHACLKRVQVSRGKQGKISANASILCDNQSQIDSMKYNGNIAFTIITAI